MEENNMKRLFVILLIFMCNSYCCAEDFYGNTTLEDVYNAPQGEKLENFGKFINTPNGIRAIGIFMPKYGYNPKTGKMNDPYEEQAKYMEEQQYKQKKLEIMQNSFRSIED